MNTRIMLTALVLVNGFATPAVAAAKISKNDIGQLISWVEQTGKDRDDYNADSATLIGLKPGEARAKARGVPAKGSNPFHYIHLFAPSGGKKFLVLKKGTQEKFSTYKIDTDGKLHSGYMIETRADASRRPASPKLVKLKANASARKAAAEEVAFWLARAKQDELKQQSQTSEP